MSPQTVLSVTGLTKQFPGVVALDRVNLDLHEGEVHALMGENGAGKSTLIKLLTGVHPADAGEIRLQGAAVAPNSPENASRLGISAVFQEINLLPNLTVGENICLGRESRGLFGIRWRELHARAAKALGELGVELSPHRQLRTLSIAERQMVAIARAVDVSARVLILDEPTSSLDRAEVLRLFELVQRLKSRGVSVLFVTHFINQMYEIANRVTVLRNGSLVGTYSVSELSKKALVEAMIGRTWSEERESVSKPERGGSVLLEANKIGRKQSVENVSLRLQAGEVYGFAGLLGSGRTEAIRLLFGLDRLEFGELRVDGKLVSRLSPSGAISFGFGFCPEDRKHEALFPNLSLRENIAIAMQVRNGWLRKLSKKQQKEIAEKQIKRFSISTRGVETPVGQLSGGNQQKVILSRWLSVGPRALFLDEPTRGVDVGAKAEIESALQKMRSEGMSILFVASEIEEVVRLSSRVAVFRDRRMIEEVSGGDLNEQRILTTIAEASE